MEQSFQGTLSKALTISAALRHDMRVAFDRAKRWWWWTLILDVLLVIVAFWAALGAERHWAISALFGMLGILARIVVNRRADTLFGIAEHCRRLMLIGDSLAREPSPQERLDLNLSYGLNRSGSKKVYYASESEPGVNRLSENIAESAFFSAEYASYSLAFFGTLWVLLIGGTLGAVWLIAATPLPADAATLSSWLRLVPPLVAFLASGHLVSAVFAFQALRSGARETWQAALLLANPSNPAPLDTAMLLLAKYEWLLARCIPLPNFVHWLWSAKVNDRWTLHGKCALPSLGGSTLKP